MGFFVLSIIFLLLNILIAVSTARASFIDLNAMYLTDNLTTTTTAAGSKILTDFSLGFKIDNAAKFNVGWNLTNVAISDSTATTTTFSSADQGIKILVFFDNALAWGFGAAYNMVAKAKYNDGTTEEEWRGSSIKFDIGYAAPINELFFAGLHLNYYSASYNEQILNKTSLATIAYARPIIYPSIYLSFRYK